MEPQDARHQRLSRLMQAVQAGDGRAYAELLAEITPILRGVVRNQRRFLDQADIEDLTQDILLALHGVRATYDPQRPFLPWLLGIVRNRLSDRARLYARHGAHEMQVENLPVTFSDEAANIDNEGYRDPELLKQAIEALPPGQRTAIEMLKVQEMSLKEAAAKTGMTIGALKVAVHRGMAALRAALKKNGNYGH